MNNYYFYGRNLTFSDVYSNVDAFLSEYRSAQIPQLISEQSCTTLYYLLYARFGNRQIASFDANQFNYQVLSTIFMYGPTWEKRLEVQADLRSLSLEELMTGSKAIYNHSMNPSTAPSTATLEELTTIDAQNTTNYKKSKMEAYSNLLALLETDVTADFLSRFDRLFIKILAEDKPYLFATEEVTNL